MLIDELFCETAVMGDHYRVAPPPAFCTFLETALIREPYGFVGQVAQSLFVQGDNKTHIYQRLAPELPFGKLSETSDRGGMMGIINISSLVN